MESPCASAGGSGIICRMKQPKQFSSRKEWEGHLWSEVINHLSKSKTKKELQQKVEGLFSDHERGLAMRRLTTLFLLRDGLSYRKIGEILWASPATISAIKKSAARSIGYLGRKNKKGGALLSPQDFIEKKASKISGFLVMLGDLAVAIQEGYGNRKKLWDFYHKYSK